ncbi:MAG TPA: SCO1664 family protein [Acidimicrobiales bacterium]|nr:SCO1664 family protein [Acidimicrobiales bacterium]
MPPHERAQAASALSHLACGEIELKGRMPWSSNATFLVEVTQEGVAMRAVYKPVRGEQPLWDFPDGLYVREAAAYLLSEALGWGIVPETIVRQDCPLGPGSLQRFVPADFSEHYFTLLERPEHHDALKTIATFDLLANNADRKGGHCLLGEDGRIWAIDNGLSFHAEPHLRTVIWDFAGEPIPAPLVADAARLADAGVDGLAGLDGLLHPVEIDALRRRAASVAQVAVFPGPGSRHAYPWPLV